MERVSAAFETWSRQLRSHFMWGSSEGVEIRRSVQFLIEIRRSGQF